MDDESTVAIILLQGEWISNPPQMLVDQDGEHYLLVPTCEDEEEAMLQILGDAPETKDRGTILRIVEA